MEFKFEVGEKINPGDHIIIKQNGKAYKAPRGVEGILVACAYMQPKDTLIVNFEPNVE